MVRMTLYSHIIDGDNLPRFEETDLIAYLSNRGIENAENAIHAWVADDTGYGKEQMYDIVIDESKKSNLLQVIADIAIETSSSMSVNIWNDDDNSGLVDIAEHPCDEVFSYSGDAEPGKYRYYGADGTELNWSSSN